MELKWIRDERECAKIIDNRCLIMGIRRARSKQTFLFKNEDPSGRSAHVHPWNFCYGRSENQTIQWNQTICWRFLRIYFPLTHLVLKYWHFQTQFDCVELFNFQMDLGTCAVAVFNCKVLCQCDENISDAPVENVSY